MNYPRLQVPDAWTRVEYPASDPRTYFAFQGGVARRKAATAHLRAPNWVFPGVHAADMRYRQFCAALARDASRLFPARVREDGFADSTAVTADFSALLSVSGAEMVPATAPLLDRSRLLESKHLSLDFVSSQDRDVFRAGHRLMFGKRRADVPMRFARLSSTSNPFFEYDVVWKNGMITHALANVPRVLDLVMASDLDALRREFAMVFCSTLVKRRQSEGGTGLLEGKFEPKPREVVDREYAATGGKRGRRFVADKRFALRPWIPDSYPDAAAMRVRTAWGYGAAVTYFLTAAFTGARAYYYDEFAFTWHHTTPEQIAAKVRGAYAVMGADVTQMDQLYPDFLLAAHAEWLGDYFHPAIAKMEDMVNWSAFYAPSPGPGIPAYWGGDPRRIDGSVRPGLNSGRASNPDLGKWGMTFSYVCMLARIWPDILTWRGTLEDSLAGFLKGEHPDVALLDMADDAVFIVRDTDAGRAGAPQLDAMLRSGRGSPYFAIGFEDGIAFLGNVLRRDEQGRDLDPVPNPLTYLVNMFAPEHGIDSPHRRYWGLGVQEREKHYAATPLARELSDLVISHWQRHFDASIPHPYAAAAAHAREIRPEALGGDTYADIAVRLNPDYLHYRFTAADVSEATLNLTTSSVSADALKALDPYLPPAT